MAMTQGFCVMRKLIAPSMRNIAARTFAALPPEVVIFPDHEMAVCWHPEQDFPYECSSPLPKPEEPAYSILKIQARDARDVFARKQNGKELALELGKLTFTTMHRWFPRSRDKKAKKTKPDRPYL